MPGSPNPPAGNRSLPTLRADLLLLHAPATFEFRGRRDIYFPFMGTSGDVPITPLYEYFPLGFKALERFLGTRNHAVKILNLSALFLLYPQLELETVLRSLDVKLLGIDLHWMVHAQGSLSVAERVKQLRPDLPVIFGGISSSYYAEELIRYPQVDMVMRGYDTLEPMASLLSAVKGRRRMDNIPNLLWKSPDGQVHDNGISPSARSFGCGIDWSTIPQDATVTPLGIREILSTQNAGCAHDCGWCGGSRDSFRRIFKGDHPIARKSAKEIAHEFHTLRSVPHLGTYHYYSVGFYNEPPRRMASIIDHIADLGVGSVNYEQFHLTPEEWLQRMASANGRTSITLSPESHDIRIGKLAGRGAYTNEELERWLERALHHGIRRIDIWYFVGMPEQDERSVQGTLGY
ncbi:MAG TPA: cobalamin-dependent protein, partial [Anaeromyxobacteraceae bacterium]|nr:cobalamin-dependent protein [Anaeromyxobacteraceae bacterium]